MMTTRICRGGPPAPNNGAVRVGAGSPRPSFRSVSVRFPHYWGLGGLFLTLLSLPALAENPALPNFHPVAPGIWRGAAPTDAGLKQLKAMGVKTIIDLRISPKLVKKEGREARALGFHWINLPMGAEAPTPAQVKTFLATLDLAPNEPVYVHCQHGADRTGCMVGIYREVKQGWGFDKTWAEMRQDGFNPRWHKLTGAVKARAK